MDVQQSPAPQGTAQPQQPAPVASPVIQTPPTVTAPIAPTTPPQPSKASTAVWWILGAFLTLLIIAAGAYFLLPKNELVIADQALTQNIYVGRLVLTRPAMLAIRRVSVVEGVNTVAHSILLEPGEYREFEMRIEADLVITPLAPGDSLYGILYEDTDGDEGLNESVDRPLRDIFGRQTRAFFKIL